MIMFENCKNKDELREEAKSKFYPLLEKMDEHVSDLIDTTDTEKRALIGIAATANRIKEVCEAYINKADELEKHKSQSENNDFTKGFILGMTWAALMSDDEECD